jgi:hypothetical protein
MAFSCSSALHEGVCARIGIKSPRTVNRGTRGRYVAIFRIQPLWPRERVRDVHWTWGWVNFIEDLTWPWRDNICSWLEYLLWFITTVSVHQNIQYRKTGWSANNEPERKQKEALVTYFAVLSRNAPAETEEGHGKGQSYGKWIPFVQSAVNQFPGWSNQALAPFDITETIRPTCLQLLSTRNQRLQGFPWAVYSWSTGEEILNFTVQEAWTQR